MRYETSPERERAFKVVAGGSITEALCGVAVVVLSIIALAGNSPGFLASIATIVLGVALVAQGGSIASRYRQLLHDVTAYGSDARAELGGGMGAEIIGGAAGIVLGILALIGVGTGVLLPIAVIVFGGSLLLGSSSTVDLSMMGVPVQHERFAHVTRQASLATSGMQALVGISAVVLGILALVGLDTVVLTLVALLVLGGAVLLSGSAVSSRMAALLRR
ncbi:Hypothetical protein A7982_05370 [Minicystis rosea]|nr:Hypothetical protein A7982_05370 [Minicystis rosea]